MEIRQVNDRKKEIGSIKIRTKNEGSYNIASLLKNIKEFRADGATDFYVREDRSQTDKTLYGVWIEFYSIRSKKEIKELRIKRLKKSLELLEKE